jgi:hypothetical protein
MHPDTCLHLYQIIMDIMDYFVQFIGTLDSVPWLSIVEYIFSRVSSRRALI